MAGIEAAIAAFTEAAFGMTSRLSPLYLAACLLIAIGLYRVRRPEHGFRQWLLPSALYRHSSTRVDLQLFLLGRLMAVGGLFNAVALRTLTATLVLAAAGGRAEAPEGLSLLVIGGLIFLINDFGVYWVHRLHHESPVFWPFHAVHHSAEVLTPLTVYRKHPIYDLLSGIVRGVLTGLLQGVLLALFIGRIEVATLAGANAFYVIFNLAGANFRHSHIWLRFGRVLEHVFISPAQHQIHHSRAPAHHDRNYGEVLALWDWMFGTLYIPDVREELEFGLAEADGTPVQQPHGSLVAALLVPFRESGKVLRGGEAAVESASEASSR